MKESLGSIVEIIIDRPIRLRVSSVEENTGENEEAEAGKGRNMYVGLIRIKMYRSRRRSRKRHPDNRNLEKKKRNLTIAKNISYSADV